MTAGQDVVYANKGVQESESRADALHKKIELHPNDAHVTSQLLADAHKGTPTEQRAFWQHLQLQKGDKSADTHLPEGFHVVGEDGKHVVTDKKGHIVYDEAKTAAKAAEDAKIHAGEGPYAAFRRQGMTDAEAKAAARDVVATTGKGKDGFKQGESYTRDDQGQGNWHKEERDKAAAAAKLKAEQDADAAKKAKQEADAAKAKSLDGDQSALDANTKKGSDALAQFGWRYFKEPYLTKSDIESGLKSRSLTADQKDGLTYLKDHFDKMSKPDPDGWDDRIDAGGIASFKQAQEKEIAKARAQLAAS